MNRQYRQGDVFIEEIDEIPAAATVVPRENGTVVLAYGEATGHAHAIRGEGAQQLVLGDRRFLALAQPEVLFHEEHHRPDRGKVVELPARRHEITRQEEYIEGELRQVAD